MTKLLKDIKFDVYRYNRYHDLRGNRSAFGYYKNHTVGALAVNEIENAIEITEKQIDGTYKVIFVLEY